MKVRITAGTYGRRDERGFLKPVRRGETCDVSETEGARLCSLGIAEAIEQHNCVGAAEPETAKPEDHPVPDTSNRGELAAMRISALRILADNRGAMNVRKMSKEECIEFILAHPEAVPEEGNGGDEEDDAPPVFDAGEILA